MNGMNLILSLHFLFVSLCHTLPMVINDDELAVEVNNRVNKEIDFDQMLQKYNLTSFRSLLKQAKLFEKLNVTTTSYTVFAPTNKAIINAAKGVLSNTTRLSEILQYHVHLGAFPTSRIVPNMKVKTLLGGQQKIRFERYNGAYYGSCQPLGSVTDATYDNGILDIMNGVMNPPEGDVYDILSKTSTFSSFFKYVNQGSIQQMFRSPGPMTLLVPNDAAFEKLSSDVKEKMDSSFKFLHDVLEYHLLLEIYCLVGFETGKIQTYTGESINVSVSGTKVVFNSNSTVIQADIIAYNGVMQVIDTVLIPPQAD
ncbi:periostin-like [Dendronephthya gigantea]|uniref:periostin-like n=1 Tax=Dendronephthya gigantea TaxID=151771 RepID=UPI00106A5B46|nr:periostin-like [Dendronephthya gigantea]